MTIRQKLALESALSAVERLLPKGYPTVTHTAQELCLSPRTLQRRLSDAGVSYRELIQACRLERARYLLAGSKDDIGEIATQLGYADASSFSRFFLRLTGMSPRAYRAQARSGIRPEYPAS